MGHYLATGARARLACLEQDIHPTAAPKAPASPARALVRHALRNALNPEPLTIIRHSFA